MGVRCACLGLLCPCCQYGGAGGQGLLIPVLPQDAHGCFLVQVLETWISEDDLWFCWNNSREYHHFGGKKLSLAISNSGCSSWFFLLLLEVELMGFFTGWLLVCTGQLNGLCFFLAWVKRLPLPLQSPKSAGSWGQLLILQPLLPLCFL